MAQGHTSNHTLQIHNSQDAGHISGHHTHTCRNPIIHIQTSISHHDSFELHHITHDTVNLYGHQGKLFIETPLVIYQK